MIEKNKVMLLNGGLPIRIEEDVVEALPDGSEEHVVKFRKLVCDTEHIVSFSKDITVDVGKKNNYEEFPLLRDLGVSLSIAPNVYSLVGSYVWCNALKSVCRIIHLDKDLIKKGTVVIGVLKEGSNGIVVSYTTQVNINAVWPLAEGCLFIDKSGTNVTGEPILGVVVKQSLPAMLGQIFVSSLSNPEVSININISRVFVPKMFLLHREENNVQYVPFKTMKGEKAQKQVLRECLPATDSSQYKLGNLVSLPLSGDKDTLVCKIVELPSRINGNHLGICPISPGFDYNVTLESGASGLYINPESVSYLTIGLSGNIKGRMLTVLNYSYEGKNLHGLKCKALGIPTISDEFSLEAPNTPIPLVNPQTVILQMPFTKNSFKRNSTLVEFLEDVGGHSADGRGSPGRCLVVPTSCLSICSDDLAEITQVIGEQKALFVDTSAIKELETILETMDKIKLSPKILDILAETRLDIENIVGKLLSNCSIRIVEKIPNIIILDNFLVPISSIRFAHVAQLRTKQGSSVKDVANTLLNKILSKNNDIPSTGYKPIISSESDFIDDPFYDTYTTKAKNFWSEEALSAALEDPE